MVENTGNEGFNKNFESTVGLQSYDAESDSIMMPNPRRRSFVLVMENPEEEILNRLAGIAPNILPLSSKESRPLTKVVVTIYDDSKSNYLEHEQTFETASSLVAKTVTNCTNEYKGNFQNVEGNKDLNNQCNGKFPKYTIDTNIGTSLYVAIENNKLDMVEELLSDGVDCDIFCDGIAPIHLAAQHGRLEILKMLLDHGVDPNSRTSLGLSSLHIAAREGFLNIIELLLSKRAEVDAQDSDYLTPLHMASYYDHVSCVDLLLKNGASINLTSHDGNTALHFASQQGNAMSVRTLLIHGAKSETLNKDGINSFHLAAYNGHVKCLEILLDFRMCEIDMEELLHIASNVNDVDTLSMLLKRGVNVNALNSDKLSAIHICAVSGNLECLNVVLENGADVNLKGECGYTPLALAVEENEIKCVECLLKHSADVHIKLDNGWNALHIAASLGHVECVQILLKYGANVNEVSKADKEIDRITAKQLAERNKHIQCVQLLSGIQT